MNQNSIRIILQLLIFLVKTRQLGNVLRIAIWIIKTKASYDEAMGRIDGSYYANQVSGASKRYLNKQPKTKYNVAGYENYLNAISK